MILKLKIVSSANYKFLNEINLTTFKLNFNLKENTSLNYGMTII